MVTLNLIQDPSYALMHSATSIKLPMTDKEFLEQEVRIWLSSPERHMQLISEQYYEGIQDICSRKRLVVDGNGDLVEDKKLPNNKIVDNQFAKMVDQKSNYFCGLPFSFVTEDKAYADELNTFFNFKKRSKIRSAAELAFLGGKCWAFPYYDINGEFTFTLWPAYEVLPFWADAEHSILDCAVHFYDIYEYDENHDRKVVHKVEVLHGGGIEKMIWDGSLRPDPDAQSGSYITVTRGNKTIPYNWEKMPLICFKANHRELPLLKRVKCLQDALNLLLSNLVNASAEDIHNTILVIKNYDGENLGELRHNLAEYAAVKVQEDGGISTLTIEVNAENQKVIIDLIKKAIIENARGFDAKDERLNGSSPNKMNIQSMYSDIDLDNNAMTLEFQSAFEELLFFVNAHLKNTKKKDFSQSQVTVLFNPDILVNEAETIENCSKSQGILSERTIVGNHPWVTDVDKEMQLIEKEREERMNDPYESAFLQTAGSKGIENE